MDRDRFARQSLGTLHGRVKQSRILMIGAGGIGCELLKNLALTGFGEIHIVDLDTIDLSNLNRQFLFRREHIKKSKALVAKESAQKFNPYVKLEAHHANIKDSRFNVEFFQSFNLVFNALDNLDARRHVNKMCLAADVPLIESGTAGFNGQVQVIKKGKTECYECNPKETPKSFPVCTIRSTPSQPIHCIVWAKNYLFPELFGVSEDEMPEFDHSEDSENAQEIENLKRESQELKKVRDSMGSPDFHRNLFEKIFKIDIDRLRSMEDMWKSRNPPQPLDYDDLLHESSLLDASIRLKDQIVWSKAENLNVFMASLTRLSDRAKLAQIQSGSKSSTILTFDKDDEDTLDFVTASANLRSINFDIEAKSKFDVKQMAGNIIPAIATTNAMTAGLCVLQAFKVMRAELEKAKMVFLERSTARVINTDTLRPPNPNCNACGVVQSGIVVDLTRATLSDLVEDVLKAELGYSDELTVNNEVGTLYDPELDENLPKKFSDLGVTPDSFLTVIDDDDDNPKVNLSLSISNRALAGDSKPVSLSQKLEIPRKPVTPQTNGLPVINGLPAVNGASAKRKRSADGIDDIQQQDLKRGKVSKTSTDEEIIYLDDSGNGAILIED